jgi:Domain of unknown function (DUF2703)
MAATSSATACGCDQSCTPDQEAAGSVTLPIVWQRLVDRGQTCPRCGETQEAVERAVSTLTEVLRPLHIEPTLQTVALDQGTFEQAPAESNRIWIAGHPLEEWIGADVSVSGCRSVCGDHDCRTVELEGATYEAVPEKLIVKAGLAAAAALLGR